MAEEDEEFPRFPPRNPRGGRDRRDPREVKRDLLHGLRDAKRDLRESVRDADPAERAHAFAAFQRARALQEREFERTVREEVSRHRDEWGRPPRRMRGLSRADIVDIAIAIADAEGTEAVSMRRIAREMRAGAMSLYWHVASKEELLKLMLDVLQAEIEVPEPSGDWRADLRSFAGSTRAVLLRHPWAVDLLGVGPPYGPNVLRNGDRLLGILDGLGLETLTAVKIAGVVGVYVTGAVLQEIQEIRAEQEEAEATASMTEAEIAEAGEEFARWLMESADRYPYMAQVAREGIDPDAPETRDERFEFGLDCVLDGIAARIPPRPGVVPPPAPAGTVTRTLVVPPGPPPPGPPPAGGPPPPPGAASPPEVHE